MPSLDALAAAEARLGLPCLSAAAATARQILGSLELDAAIPGFGSFLARPTQRVPSYGGPAARQQEVVQ